MIRYSHVSLIILCDTIGVQEITDRLGRAPSRVDHDPEQEPPQTGLTHTWRIDSPLGDADADPTGRLVALLNVIEPLGPKIASLDKRYSRWIDIIYHVTPQHFSGVTGEFDWFQLPKDLIKKLAVLDIDLSYETFWFNHPEWNPPKKSWWEKIFGK